MSQVIRRHEINRRRKRQSTVRRLRAKLAKATSNTQKQAILAKLHKVAPWIPDREWLNPAQLSNQTETVVEKQAKRAAPARRAA